MARISPVQKNKLTKAWPFGSLPGPCVRGSYAVASDSIAGGSSAQSNPPREVKSPNGDMRPPLGLGLGHDVSGLDTYPYLNDCRTSLRLRTTPLPVSEPLSVDCQTAASCLLSYVLYLIFSSLLLLCTSPLQWAKGPGFSESNIQHFQGCRVSGRFTATGFTRGYCS